MAKTIEQLEKEIAEQRKRIAKEEVLSKSISERQELSKQLFQLKHKKLIGAGAKAKRLSKRFGKSLLKAGQKAAPVIKKQAQLIRDQQLRDDAIDRARSKKLQKGKKPKKVLTTKRTITFVPIKKKKKRLLKTIVVTQKIKKKSKPKKKGKTRVGGTDIAMGGEAIFQSLDF